MAEVVEHHPHMAYLAALVADVDGGGIGITHPRSVGRVGTAIGDVDVGGVAVVALWRAGGRAGRCAGDCGRGGKASRLSEYETQTCAQGGSVAGELGALWSCAILHAHSRPTIARDAVPPAVVGDHTVH